MSVHTRARVGECAREGPAVPPWLSGTPDPHRRKCQKGAYPALSGAWEEGIPGRQPREVGTAQVREPRPPRPTPSPLPFSLRPRAAVAKPDGLATSSWTPIDPQGSRRCPLPARAPLVPFTSRRAPFSATGGFLLRRGWRRVSHHPPFSRSGAPRLGWHRGGSLCDQAGYWTRARPLGSR